MYIVYVKWHFWNPDFWPENVTFNLYETPCSASQHGKNIKKGKTRKAWFFN